MLSTASDLDVMVSGNFIMPVVGNFFDSVPADAGVMITPQRLNSITAQFQMLILHNSNVLIVTYSLVAVMADVYLLVVFDLLASVVTHVGGVVVLDVDVLVFFSMDINFFLPQLILKAQLIETFTFMGSALDGHPRLVFRQLVGRQVGLSVGGPSGDRLIRISVQVADH